MPPSPIASSPKPIAPRVPIAPTQKWNISGKDFVGTREDVIAAIEGLQSVPDEWAVATIAALNSLDKSVRLIRVNLHYTSTGKEGHINGHWEEVR